MKFLNQPDQALSLYSLLNKISVMVILILGITLSDINDAASQNLPDEGSSVNRQMSGSREDILRSFQSGKKEGQSLPAGLSSSSVINTKPVNRAGTERDTE